MMDYNTAKTTVMLMLKNEPKIDGEKIQQKIMIIKSIAMADSPDSIINWDRLSKEVESAYNTWIDQGKVLYDKKGHEKWLPDRKLQIKWRFWRRYARFLEEEKGWSELSIKGLNGVSDQILERLEDPQRQGKWSTRGVVVGEVQSGKTTNYNALICKAVDAGYKLIIVLAGLHKSLRSQTQMRLDEGFLGFDTKQSRKYDSRNVRIGVGKLIGEDLLIAHSLTSSEDDGDFKRKVAKQMGIMPGGDPLILVVKKNKSVLKNLHNWALSVRGEVDHETNKTIVRDIPLLVIDDEADNASINTKPVLLDEDGEVSDESEVTAINSKIRQLLDAFEKSAYVGYTATPFANIFILPNIETDEEGEDLFPRSFIINLSSPPNHIGPKTVFGIAGNADIGIEEQRGLPITRPVEDHETFIPDKHTKDYIPVELPKSLKKAILSFIISSAARMARGEEKAHNSMLIHVTRYTAVQHSIAELVQDELDHIKKRLEYGDGGSKDKLIDELELIWNLDYLPTSRLVKERLTFPDPLLTDLSWDEINGHFLRAASKIEVKEINGTAADILDYRDTPGGLSVIAIGGDKLSRGLTLEGLTVSYYLRATKMYDTLMQMGRWFGYRPGYIDLCRLYTTDDLIKNYRLITLASEELRKEFDYMVALGQTPEYYGLRVRTYPDVDLLVTAQNKMRSGRDIETTYAECLAESVILNKNSYTIDKNYKALENFIKRREQFERSVKSGNYIWKNQPADDVINLLREIDVTYYSNIGNAGSLIQYIENQRKNKELTDWTISLINNTMAGQDKRLQIGANEIGLTKRKDATPKDANLYTMTNSRIISPADELLDLTGEQKDEAIAMQVRENPDKKRPENPGGKYIRRVRDPKNGLMLIYLLDPAEIDATIPVVGLAISFPKSDTAMRLGYRVNIVSDDMESEDDDD